ncbi:HAD family hydrolase [Chromatium weissei]|nr:HAD family hydrolase [Chromatium weissei]
MSFELLVFDWDGTLMDSEARIVTCLQAAFRDLDVPEPSPAIARDVIGLGLQEAMERLLPTANQALRQAVSDGYRRHFLVTNQTRSQLFDGVRETLKQLAAQNYLLAVATGKSRIGLNQSLAETGLLNFFHATRCADETCSKPNPQMLLEIMNELAVAPAATLMIGDTEYDLQMAQNAGTAAIAVACGVHSIERLLAFNPLACFDDINAIPEWLNLH